MSSRLRNNDRIFTTRIPKVGRPRKFESVEQLQELIDDYFNSCFIPVRRLITLDERDPETGEIVTKEIADRDEDGNILYEQIKPFTVTGLAVALGTSRDVLLDYQNEPKFSEYSDTIKAAKQMIQNYAEDYLFTGKNQTGAIFNLKNNWNWVDRTEQGIEANIKTSDEDASDKADNILEIE